MHTQGTGEDYYLDASSDFWDIRFFFRSRRTGRWISGIYPSGRFKTSAKMSDSMLFTRSQVWEYLRHTNKYIHYDEYNVVIHKGHRSLDETAIQWDGD